MTNAPAFHLFDTPIGRCGIAWSERGILALQLPEASDETTRARLLRRAPGARPAPPPPEMRRALDLILALLDGKPSDLGSIELDLSGVPEFDRCVYDIARAIPPGATRSYGEIALELGDPGLARAVGRALGRNPFAIIVPCHRVLAAGGRIGGFSAEGGTATKRRLLAIESAVSGESPSLFEHFGLAAGGIGRASGTVRPQP